jgi:circadian clock protein KaiB
VSADIDRRSGGGTPQGIGREDPDLPPATDVVVVELYIQDQAPQSSAAVDVVRRVCETYLPSRHRLDVIDIRQEPERTRDAGIMAVPALLRLRPAPLVRTVGQLDEARVLRTLGIERSPAHESEPG